MTYKTLFVLMLFTGLVGCAAPPPVWNKPGATQTEFDSDRRYCEFEVMKATQTTDTSYRTIIGQEMDRAMRQRDLAASCMRMKGYTQQ